MCDGIPWQKSFFAQGRRGRGSFLLVAVNQKLEEEEENHKALSLDPQRNHHLHHLHLYQNQNQEIQNYVAESEQNHHSASPHVHLFHQNQLLYGGGGATLDSDHHHTPPPAPPRPPQPKKRAPPEHARLLRDKMAESSGQQQRAAAAVRSAAVGEVVEVQGGHIVRATGRKDRHSKVCTAKGPRDRRVRLAAHTAIQFYDVQDRLGYDRPSKAVDWLIKKAKSSIDELAQLPAWHPTATAVDSEQKQNSPVVSNVPGTSSKRAATMAGGEDDDHHRHRNISHNPNTQIASFLPPSMDSDAIADTIKSFFPVGASGEATSSAMQFHSFNSSDLMSRSGSHSQDLRLSLHSLQDPILLQHQSQSPNHSHSQSPRLHGQVLLSGTPLGFDGGWADHHHQQAAELSRLQRFADAAPAAYFFNPPPAQQPPPPPLLQQLLGHNQFVSQRGPLQSSNTPSVRAWFDPPPSAAASSGGGFDHGHHHQQQGSAPFYPSSVSGFGFTSGYGGFPGFHIPARIQGDEEEHDGYSDKPSSASSDSRH